MSTAAEPAPHDSDSHPSAPLTQAEHRALLADIARSVADVRASGRLPKDFEHQLSTSFVAVAPRGATGDDPAEMLSVLEAAAHIDIGVPTGSNMPGVGYLKAVIARLMAWYLLFVVRQIVGFAGLVARNLRRFDVRVTQLEATAAPGDPAVLARIARRLSVAEAGGAAPTDGAAPPTSRWPPDLVEAVAEVVALRSAAGGRTFVANAGDGDLCAQLIERGLDAYGVDPDRLLVFEAASRGIDVRPDTPQSHLAELPVAGLGAVVLVGSPLTASLGARLRLLELGLLRLSPGGALVIVDGGADALPAQLCEAPVWSGATWAAALGELGAATVDEHRVGDHLLVVAHVAA